MQFGQKVRRPGNRVGLAGTGRVLNQVLAAGAIAHHGGLELARHVELVIAREDDFLNLLLGVALGNQVAAQNLQPAFPCPHLLPQIRSPVATQRIGRVTRSAVVAQIERQKNRGRAIEPGHHVSLFVAHRKMHQRPRRERQQRLRRLPLGLGVPVKAVLVNRVLHALGEVCLELHRGHRQAV